MFGKLFLIIRTYTVVFDNFILTHILPAFNVFTFRDEKAYAFQRDMGLYSYIYE